MKKFFTLFAAALVVLSASAAPVKMAKVDKAQLPAIEKKINHNRFTPAQATATSIKKAPAAISNGQIVADYSQAYYLDSSIVSGPSLWEIDFYDGNDFAAYVIVEAIDGTHIAGTYNSIEEGRVVVAAGDTTEVVSGSLTIAYDVPSASYQFALSITCDNSQTYTLNQSLEYNEDFFALDYELVMYLEAGFGFLVGVSSYNDCLITLKDAPYIPVVVTDTVAVTFYPYYNAEGEGGWDDNVEELGWWQYQGETADQSLYITISPVYADQVAGTYTIDDMDLDFTYIYDEVAGAGYDFESLDVVVTENGGVVTLTATGVCMNGIYYIITCEMEAPMAVENVEAVKAQKTIQNGQLVILKNGVKYNAQGAQL